MVLPRHRNELFYEHLVLVWEHAISMGIKAKALCFLALHFWFCLETNDNLLNLGLLVGELG